MVTKICKKSTIEQYQIATQIHINKLIVYLEENIDQKLTLEELADIAGYSPFHVHRIFRAFVGETLGGFIQRMRMGKAVNLLLNSKQTITEIALQTGYQTPAGFTKAFKKIFYTTPSQVRKTRTRPIYPTISLQKVADIRRYEMEALIKELPTKRVLTITRKGLIDNNFNKAADEAFCVLTRFINANHAWSAIDKGCLGICPDDGVDVPPEESRYIAGYFLKEDGDVWARGEVKIMELPAGRVAVFVHKGSYDTLWQTWNKIYHDWLPGSGEKLRDTYPYEVYLKEKGTVPDEELITKIYIPIE